MINEGNRPNQLQAWSYVFIQGVILALLIFFSRKMGPQIHRFVFVGTLLEWLGVAGVLICAASLRRSLTAVPIPKEDGTLSTSGLYR